MGRPRRSQSGAPILQGWDVEEGAEWGGVHEEGRAKDYSWTSVCVCMGGEKVGAIMSGGAPGSHCLAVQ